MVVSMINLDLQRAFYEMLMESQWWSHEELVDYQRSQLEQLLRHAKKNVPFYESRLDSALDEKGNVNWERWTEIPIVRRSDMIQYRDAMQARELPKGHGPASVSRTSGSTGLAIEITVPAIAALASNGFRLRVHRWQNLDWSKTLCSRLGDTAHAAEWPEGEPTGFWGPPWDESARKGGSWKISRDLSSEFLFAFFKEHRCAYLNAGPNMAHINALDALRLGINLRIEAILAQGNVVRQSDRDICKKVFGAKLIEHYSAKEGGQIAHPCPHDRLHVNVEGCLVEILDEQDQPVPPGQVGRVIVTPFFQTAQPVIRYEQGDWAVRGEACTCGRQSPTIAAIKGRNIAIFHRPDGRSIANLMPDDTAEILAAQYWQLAQVGPDQFELRYVPGTEGREGDEDQVRRIFAETFFSDANLTLVRRDHIPLQSSGKLAEYVNEWSLGLN